MNGPNRSESDISLEPSRPLEVEVAQLAGRLAAAEATIDEQADVIARQDELLDYVVPLAAKEVKRSRWGTLEQATQNQDGLTGLLGHRPWLEELDSRIGDEQGQFGILFLDLDKFKLVNDEKGHPVGDRVIVRFAATLQKVLRADLFTHIPGRVGGDEFAVLCDLEPRHEAGKQMSQQERIEAISTRVANSFDALIDEEFPELRELQFGYSIGVSIGEPGKTAIEMIQEAEQEVHEQKTVNRLKSITEEEREKLLSTTGQETIAILAKMGVRIPKIPER